MPDRYRSTKVPTGFKVGLVKTSDLVTHGEKGWISIWAVPASSVGQQQ